MAGDNLYKFYGTKEELARWARSHPGACPVCCNLDIESWDGGIPIRTPDLPKSRENCTFCDILFNAMQTPYFSSLTEEPDSYMRAFLSTSGSQGDISYRRLMVRLKGITCTIDKTCPSLDKSLLTREWSATRSDERLNLSSSSGMAIRHRKRTDT
jgi:hypothetical protein